MRLAILDDGHQLGTRLLFSFIRLVSRQPTPEVLKVVAYRPEFFGTPMKEVTQEAMRGPSEWSVADRELMAAYVAKVNGCEFCIRAHSAVAAKLYADEPKVSRALSDPDTAGLEAPLRATLRLLGKLIREQSVDASDVRAVLDAGASAGQVEDALAVCFAFDTMNRLADAFEFDVPGPEVFEAGARFLIARGYR
jgi:AhpD family alkylhydroperoxidase